MPPRWRNLFAYSNGRDVWEVEREYNLLLDTPGWRSAFRRFCLRWYYGDIYEWGPEERQAIQEHEELLGILG